jgi:hypothetical protein
MQARVATSHSSAACILMIFSNPTFEKRHLPAYYQFSENAGM